MRETKIKTNQIDYNFDQGGGGGGSSSVTLLSITTAPEPPFPAESKYYNSSNNTIYKATIDNTWNQSDTYSPSLGVFYIYDGESYIYDDKTRALFKIGESSSAGELSITNTTLAANSLVANLSVDLTNAIIFGVYVNGIYQVNVTNYSISSTNITFTSSYSEETHVTIVYGTSLNISVSGGGGSGTSNYNALSNKPQINNNTLSGNKTSASLGLQDTLVSGTNIKTINGNSILGSGDIVIQGGSSIQQHDYMEQVYTDGGMISTFISIDLDTYLSQITADHAVTKFSYDGTNWYIGDSNPSIVDLNDYGISISGYTPVANDEFSVYSFCLRNRTDFTFVYSGATVNCVYLNGLLLLKNYDYSLTDVTENGYTYKKIIFNNYTLKAADKLSTI